MSMAEAFKAATEIRLWYAIVVSLVTGLAGAGATWATTVGRISALEKANIEAVSERKIMIDKLDSVSNKLAEANASIARIEGRLMK